MSIDYSALVGPAKDPNKCREGRGVAKIKSIGEYPWMHLIPVAP